MSLIPGKKVHQINKMSNCWCYRHHHIIQGKRGGVSQASLKLYHLGGTVGFFFLLFFIFTWLAHFFFFFVFCSKFRHTNTILSVVVILLLPDFSDMQCSTSLQWSRGRTTLIHLYKIKINDYLKEVMGVCFVLFFKETILSNNSQWGGI